MRHCVYIFLVFALLLSLACGSSPTENKTITEGNWSGFYMDTIPLTFAVNGNTMEDVSISIDYQLSTSVDTTVTWTFNADISDNTFMYENVNGGTPYTFSFAFQGTFTPSDHVQGTIVTYAQFDSAGVHLSDSLDGSWSALSE